MGGRGYKRTPGNKTKKIPNNNFGLLYSNFRYRNAFRIPKASKY